MELDIQHAFFIRTIIKNTRHSSSKYLRSNYENCQPWYENKTLRTQTNIKRAELFRVSSMLSLLICLMIVLIIMINNQKQVLAKQT